MTPTPYPMVSHRGFSLVEMMVSLVIGLVILLALYITLIGSVHGLSTIEAQSAMTDSGRRAVNFVRQQLRQAGYRPLDRVITGFGFAANPDWYDQYQVVSGADDDNDSVTVRYWGADNGTVLDCSGNTVAATTAITVSITVADGQLWCTDSVTGTPQLVADNIDAFQVRYSLIDENEYINAPATASADWQRVNRVEFALLSRSSAMTANGITNSRSYAVLDDTFNAPGDRFLRTVLHESVLVRNLIVTGRR